MNFAEYTKRPHTFQAFRFEGLHQLNELRALAGFDLIEFKVTITNDLVEVSYEPAEGRVTLRLGDWVLKDRGIRIMRDEEFKQAYTRFRDSDSYVANTGFITSMAGR